MKITREGVTDIARAFLTSLLAENIPKKFTKLVRRANDKKL